MRQEGLADCPFTYIVETLRVLELLLDHPQNNTTQCRIAITLYYGLTLWLWVCRPCIYIKTLTAMVVSGSVLWCAGGKGLQALYQS